MTETFQIPLAAAEQYEARFVPAIFAEWAPLLVRAAEADVALPLLDVACGTGIVARTAAHLRGSSKDIVGLDLNDAMLTVARRAQPELDWRQGDVSALPFADASFDRVLCQMALMFFPDKVSGLREMGRVCTADGRVGLVVPAALDDQPAYRAFVDAAVSHAGPEARSLLDSYWSCGNIADLTGWLEAAHLEVLSVQTHAGTARFTSPDELVATEVSASPLSARLDGAVYERIRSSTSLALQRFVRTDGQFLPPLYGHIVTARRR